MIQFLCYKNCSTCRKARKFLDENQIEYEYREIYEKNPSYEELKTWIEKSGLPIRRFFNTSGIVYREQKLKDKWGVWSDEEAIQHLATDGRLVKRPLLIKGDTVLVGFKEDEYRKALVE